MLSLLAPLSTLLNSELESFSIVVSMVISQVIFR
jgi:hypothetical protein